MLDLNALFFPKSICVVGASNKVSKVGNTIIQNLLKFKKKHNADLFPVNLNEEKILGIKAYKKVSDIPTINLDLLVVCVPKEFVLSVLQDCAKKKTKFAIVISSGFKEIGDLNSENKLKEIAKKNKIRIVGPNVLGVLDNTTKLDTLFLPSSKEKRPDFGNISVISQSGTVGAILLDKFAELGTGINKFVSYGNASDINECDLIEFFNSDKDTKVICCYIEEIVDGKRFLKLMKTKKKPIIILKAGKSKKGIQSVQSHTGNLAGDFNVYNGVFKQFEIVNADTVNELVDFSKAKLLKPIKSTTIITNGGGYGILLSDFFEKYTVPVKEISEKTKNILRKNLPKGVSVRDPFDLMGDADAKRFLETIKLTEKETDTFVVVLLGQTPALTKETVENLLHGIAKIKKQFVFLSTMKAYTKIIAKKGFCVFENPEDLAKGLSLIVKK